MKREGERWGVTRRTQIFLVGALLVGAAAMSSRNCGTARTLLESGLTASEIMDLVPVKPLGEMEPQVGEMYRTHLPAVYQKIKP